MSELLSLHNIGTLFEPTGYAKANRQLVTKLVQQGVSVHFTAIHQEQIRVPLSPTEESLLNSLSHTPLSSKHPVLIHYPAPHFIKPVGKYTIGFTMFECTRLPLSWARRCSMMDEIWVPSSFNVTTFAKSGVPLHKIHVMPYGVDTVQFYPRPRPVVIPGTRAFVFLCVCSFDERKGITSLVTSFFEEFREAEDVCLIIKTRASSEEEILRQNHFIQQLAQQVSGTPRSSIILLSTTDSWTEEQLANLYNCANCYVLPTKGEGWSMTVMEAMASRLPVITTNWSAHLDFLNHDNGYLIQVQGYEPSHPTQPHLRWAIPNPTHLRQLMRHVYNNPEEASHKAALGRKVVEERYQWEHSAANIVQRLKQLQ